MTYLLEHWSSAPFLLGVILVAIWHEIGLRRLLRRSRRDRIRRRRQRSLLFLGGLTVLYIAVGSPVDYWGYHYFYIRVIQHLLLMLAAPSLIVAGAPWQPLLLGVPLRLRRGTLRAVLHDRWARPLRVSARLLVRPAVAVIAFNIAMVGWLLPGPFDLAERNRAVHGLASGSLLVVGLLFWVQVVASPPLRTRITPAGQAISLFATNCVLWILAMSMSVFSDHAWYPMYNHIPGVMLSAFGDQQLGAGILWICGDFWAGPAFMIAIRRLIAQEDGDVESAIRRILSQSGIGRLIDPRESHWS